MEIACPVITILLLFELLYNNSVHHYSYIYYSEK